MSSVSFFTNHYNNYAFNAAATTFAFFIMTTTTTWTARHLMYDISTVTTARWPRDPYYLPLQPSAPITHKNDAGNWQGINHPVPGDGREK